MSVLIFLNDSRRSRNLDGENAAFFLKLKELRCLTTVLSIDNNSDCNGTSLSGLERRLHTVGELVRTLSEKTLTDKQWELLEFSLYDITESLATLAGDLLEDDNDFSASIIEQYLGLAKYSLEIMQTKFLVGANCARLDLYSLQALILCGLSRLHFFQKQFDMAHLEIIEAASLFRLVLDPLTNEGDVPVVARHAKAYERVLSILLSEDTSTLVTPLSEVGSTRVAVKVATLDLPPPPRISDKEAVAASTVAAMRSDFYQL